ncbi:GlxA family transcriptional regulator [Litoreibacter janthinus]|nr:helix-turn-helix domain-containing protein [Litoreibacter janthinus]
MTSISAKTVVFIVFPNVKLLDLTGPMQVFADANLDCAGRYDVNVAARLGGDVCTDAVIPISTTPFSDLRSMDIDTLIIAGGSGAFGAAEDRDFLDDIRALAARSRRVGSVCTGAFILAHAGLLAGRSAVTHWESCDRFRETFDDITVEDDAIYVKDGNVWTSAGVTAGIDMSLAMVAEDFGRQSALALARSLVCYMVRPGGQSQFSTTLRQQSAGASGRFDELNAWIASNLTTTLSVEDLADKAAMSARNFARLYKIHTGRSPAKAVEQMRVDAACRLLEETDLPLTSIAKACGFVDDERLRRAVTRAHNIAPGEYRQRFGRGT